uniref:CD99 antigen-like protein 2 n=1 Tax=Oryzias latipes TaxID=8090 RepID=A0A3P9M988_ORYLA
HLYEFSIFCFSCHFTLEVLVNVSQGNKNNIKLSYYFLCVSCIYMRSWFTSVIPVFCRPLTFTAGGDFDLADALDPGMDPAPGDKNKGRGGGFSDQDLVDVGKDSSYKPDKGKGSGGSSDQIDSSDDTNEVGTIAGIVSAVAMALVGAVSSYISYQKKKFCFSIQQSLNTEMNKNESPEGVVATEPQGG